MVAIFFKLVLLACCLGMFLVRREYKIAILMFAYAVLSEIKVPLPMGNTLFILPILFLVSEALNIKKLIRSIRIKSLMAALVILILNLAICYISSPHYWGSISKLFSLFMHEFLTSYFILLVGFFSLKDRNSFRMFVRASFAGLIILTVFGVINYVTKESSILSMVTGGAIRRGMDVGEMFSEDIRFRTQSLFIQPFDYGYMCLIILITHVYAYSLGMIKSRQLWAVVAMALFGVITCGCRTVLMCLLIGSVVYAVMYFQGRRIVLPLLLVTVISVSVYQISPFIQEKADFLMSMFDDDNEEQGGSSVEMRALQYARVLYYIEDDWLTGCGYDFFWIDLQFSQGQQHQLDPDLQGLEGVHLKYLLERGVIGYSLYWAFYIVLLVYLFRHRKSCRKEVAAAVAVIVIYLTFAHMTGELKSVPVTMLMVGLFLRVIQNDTWESDLRKEENKYAGYRYRQLS